MKLYLAHPITKRKEVRKFEEKLEEELFKVGVELQLINPFYEVGEREDIKKIDKGKIKEWSSKLPANKIVEGDLNVLARCDGIFAYIEEEIPTIGTYMELIHNYVLQKKQKKERPTYILAPHGLKNGWLKKLPTRTFSSLEDVFRYFKRTEKPESFNSIEEIDRVLEELERVDCVIGYIDEDRIEPKTCMIVFYTAYHLKKPVYIFSRKAYGHPWLRYLTKKSGGKIIRYFKQLANLLNELSYTLLKVYFA